LQEKNFTNFQDQRQHFHSLFGIHTGLYRKFIGYVNQNYIHWRQINYEVYIPQNMTVLTHLVRITREIHLTEIKAKLRKSIKQTFAYREILISAKNRGELIPGAG
jgi:plasmid rolling circle replication initiator protein Rep